jgi:hypothetical protein
MTLLNRSQDVMLRAKANHCIGGHVEPALGTAETRVRGSYRHSNSLVVARRNAAMQSENPLAFRLALSSPQDRAEPEQQSPRNAVSSPSNLCCCKVHIAERAYRGRPRARDGLRESPVVTAYSDEPALRETADVRAHLPRCEMETERLRRALSPRISPDVGAPVRVNA